MSVEKYRPNLGEQRKAEEMMTDEQKAMSYEREKGNPVLATKEAIYTWVSSVEKNIAVKDKLATYNSLRKLKTQLDKLSSLSPEEASEVRKEVVAKFPQFESRL